MTHFYYNLIVRYVYEETNEILKNGVHRLIKTDAELKDLYIQLCDTRRKLSRNFPVQMPRKSLVDNILKYASQ
ncbi:MAG: hypothetical protein PW786_01550 [Arachidicoccus sp.]|nr:hypothetical protein [Arachidicoccus sp.]